MYFDFQFTTHDEDDEWFESLESDNEEIEMGSAVKIQDPISSLGLVPPLMVESGTNMKNALDLLQQKEQNFLNIFYFLVIYLDHIVIPKYVLLVDMKIN